MVATLLLASLLAAPAPYDPSGEVSFHVSGGTGNGASFSADRVVGPNANLTLTDGLWSGDLVGQNVQLEVTAQRITGAGVDLHLERSGAKRGVRGMLFGQRISLERSDHEVSGRIGSCSFALKKKGEGRYEGTVGCTDPRQRLPQTSYGVLTLFGDAVAPEPPSPQFVLALLATMI